MAGPEGEVKSKSKTKKLVRSLSKGFSKSFRKSLKRMSSGLSFAFSDRKSVIGKDDLDVLDHIAADMARTEDSPRNSDSPDFLIKAYHPDDASPSERDLSSSRTSQARSLSGASIELGPNGDASVPEPAPAATALDSHQDLAVSSPVEASAEKASNMTIAEDKLAADRDLKEDDASMSQVIHQSSTTPRDQPISDLNSQTLSAEALESDAPACSQSQDVSVAAAGSAIYTASTPTGWNDSAAAVSHPQSGGASPELPDSARDRESPLRESESDLVFDAAMLSMLDSMALQPGINVTEDDIQPETAADATPVAANSEPVLVQQCDLAAAVNDPVDPVPIPEEPGHGVDYRGSGVDALEDSFEPDEAEWDGRSMPAVIAVGDVEVGLQVFRRPAPVAATDVQEIQQESMDVHDRDFADDIEQAAGLEEVCNQPERVDFEAADATERLAADASVGVSDEVQLTENDSSPSSKPVLGLGSLDAAGDCSCPPVVDNAFEAQLTHEFDQPSEVQSAVEVKAAEAHFNVRPASEEPTSPVSCEPVLDQQAAAEPLVSFPISCANSPSSPTAPTTAPKLPEPISQPAVSRKPTSRALYSRNSSILDRYGLDDMFFSLPTQVAEDDEAAITTVVGADRSASQSDACPDVTNAEPMGGVPETLVELDAVQTVAEAAQPAVDVIAPQPEGPMQVLEVDGARVGRFMSGVLENLMVTAKVQGFVEWVFYVAVRRAEAELLADKLAEEERARADQLLIQEAAVSSFVTSVFATATRRADAELLQEKLAQKELEREIARRELAERLEAAEREREAARQLLAQKAAVSTFVNTVFTSATHRAEAELLAEKRAQEDREREAAIQLLTEKLAAEEREREAAQQLRLQRAEVSSWVQAIFASATHSAEAELLADKLLREEQAQQLSAVDKQQRQAADLVTAHQQSPLTLLPEMLEVNLIDVDYSTGSDAAFTPSPVHDAPFITRDLAADVVHCATRDDVTLHSNALGFKNVNGSTGEGDKELAALAEEVMDLERALTQLKQDSLYSSDSVAHTSGSDSGSHDDSADDDVQLPLTPQQQAAVVPPPHQDAAEDQHLMEPLQVEAPAQATDVLECADSDTVLEGSDTVLEDSTLKVEEVLDEVPAGAEYTTVPAASKELALAPVAGPLRLVGKIVSRLATSRVTKAMLLTSASLMVGGLFKSKQRPGHNSSSCCSSQTKQKKKMTMQAMRQRWL